MINLLEVLPSSADATSLYRGRLPLLRLQKHYDGQLCIYPYGNNKPGWDYINLFDAVFFQRPYNITHLRVMEAAKRNRLFTWIDYDDLLCDIPEDNPAYDHYNSEALENIGSLIHLTDVVTVSTEALKSYMAQRYGHEEKFKVIPNALDFQLFHNSPYYKESKNILWRGSHTHTNDLLEYSDEIVDVMKNNPAWTIDFIGYRPFFITRKITNSSYTPKMDLDNYISILNNLNYSICIVPLHDSPFNRSKSNIAWIESCYAGAVCLAPDWEEWKKPGVITYKDKADFQAKLKAMISGEYDLKDLHKKSWQYISNNLNLAEVNQLRAELIMRQPIQR